MKYIFNTIIAIIVVVIISIALRVNKKEAGPEVIIATEKEQFDGARTIKLCKNYFSKPISVTIDHDNEILYVSNTASTSNEKDSVGYICRTSLYGEIIDTLKNFKLKSPKGMTILGNYLYITDIDRVLKYDLSSDSISKIIKIEKSKFISDIEPDDSGRLYVSDPQGAQIFVIIKDSPRLYIKDSTCKEINSLCFVNNTLYAGAKQRIISFNNNKINTFAKVKFTVCGIRSDNKNNFIISDLIGNIYAVSPKKSELLLKHGANAYAADFDYVPNLKLLIVPTYKDNSLDIIEVGKYLESTN